LAIAQQIEQILGQMTQCHQLRGAEEAGATLDGVKAAKNIIEQATIGRISLQVDQLVVDARQKIIRLEQEILQQVFHSLKIAHTLSLQPVDGSWIMPRCATSRH